MLPEEISQSAGKVEVSTFEVEKGAIRKYADAVDDPNPLYWDEEYARKSSYGSLIAPPGFFGWPAKWEKGSTFPVFSGAMLKLITGLREAGYTKVIDGAIDYEFFCPVRAGDSLTASAVIEDIAERKDGEGKAVFVIIETTYTNQNEDLVAKVRQIFVNRQPGNSSGEERSE
ncbi:MAG: MaoC family dehydratase N-terminal domain-containing protein [Dehalococcoidales bacterium]|nr:MaoC family dehydratase N-terminal domain-containing protein [Dehalococcoidales bacterium]